MFLFSIFSLLTLGSFAQGEIRGKVIDKETDEPLYLASVYVEIGGVKQGAATDEEGKFVIKPLKPGTYTVRFQMMGYTEVVVSSVQVISDQATKLDQTAMVFGTDLDEAIVIAYERKLIDPEQTSKMSLLAAEIEDIPVAKNLNSIVATIGADIYQADEGQPLYFRGSRAGSVKYVVDGQRLPDDNYQVPQMAIRELTVYTGGVPAQYGDLMGGVIVVETKSYFDLYSASQYR